MIWEKIRSKIGQLILYFIAGQFVEPIVLNKNHNYLFVLENEVREEDIDYFHECLKTVVDGDILIVQGVELNIIGLADEDKDQH